MHLRSIALKAVDLFGISDAQVSLAKHAYNTTFRVNTPEGSFAMRVNVNSSRSVEQVYGEVAWIEALSRHPDIHVPKPHRTTSGEPFVVIESPHFSTPRVVVLYEWMYGRHRFRRTPASVGFLMGQTMRRLHENGESFQFPKGASRPVMTSVIEGIPWRAPLTPVFLEPYRLASEALARQATQKARITHFDIHFGNVKVNHGRMEVFDFDDCVMAWPMVDAAQTMFYLRQNKNGKALEPAFWEGLGSKPSDHGMSDADFNALVAGRGLLLANDLLGTQSTTLAAMAPSYLARVEFQLRSFLDTGYYDSFLKPQS